MLRQIMSHYDLELAKGRIIEGLLDGDCFSLLTKSDP